MAAPTALLTPDILRGLIAVAGRAPSLHYSQPWRFRLVADAVELLIEPQRAMKVPDPHARELVISCGAALYNLRLATRCRGFLPHADVAPASGEPLLLARVTLEQGPPPTPDERRLLAAVIHRHTHRHGSVQIPLADTLAAAFAVDVAAEGSQLLWIDRPVQVTAIAELALLAAPTRRVRPPCSSTVFARPAARPHQHQDPITARDPRGAQRAVSPSALCLGILLAG